MRRLLWGLKDSYSIHREYEDRQGGREEGVEETERGKEGGEEKEAGGGKKEKGAQERGT